MATVFDQRHKHRKSRGSNKPGVDVSLCEQQVTDILLRPAANNYILEKIYHLDETQLLIVTQMQSTDSTESRLTKGR